MPANRSVNARFLLAGDHTVNVWDGIKAHVEKCPLGCRLENADDDLKFRPSATCEWGLAFEEEWSIACARLDETARGGAAQPTQGVNHE